MGEVRKINIKVSKTELWDDASVVSFGCCITSCHFLALNGVGQNPTTAYSERCPFVQLVLILKLMFPYVIACS